MAKPISEMTGQDLLGFSDRKVEETQLKREKYEISMEGLVDTFIDDFPEIEKLSEDERLDLYRELEDRFVGRAKDWIRSWLNRRKLREVL